MMFWFFHLAELSSMFSMHWMDWFFFYFFYLLSVPACVYIHMLHQYRKASYYTLFFSNSAPESLTEKYYFIFSSSKQKWHFIFCHVSSLVIFYSELCSLGASDLDPPTSFVQVMSESIAIIPQPSLESHHQCCSCSIQVPSRAPISPHPIVVK